MGSMRGVFMLLMCLSSCLYVRSELVENFYARSCPFAEGQISGVVFDAIDRNPRTAATIIRTFFHDCFVEGCDASLLLDSPSEKDSIPNRSLLEIGYETIDRAKAAVEDICPGVVSCADVLALAARDSVFKTRGIPYPVKTGRRDGFISSADTPNDELPSPFDTVPELTSLFASKGLSQKQMVTLSGAHTIGKAHCGTFIGRIYNFSSTNDIDPTLDPSLAKSLRAACPFQTFSSDTVVDMTQTPTTFDNQYFSGLVAHKGLFVSDQELYTDGSTKRVVEGLLNEQTFQREFAEAMRALGGVSPKTGSAGEIRRNCRLRNSDLR